MASVAHLKAAPAPEPDQDIIEQVEQLLAWAKSGQLQFFVLAGILDFPGDPRNALYMRVGAVRELGTVILALERAKLNLMGYAEETAEPV